MPTQGSLCMLLALALGLPLGARTARAEDEDREAFLQGATFYEKGEYSRAIEAFLQARAIRPRAKTDFNLGRAHHRLNQLPEAATRYELAASRGAEPESARVAAKARARLKEILGQVARVRIVCAEGGAEVIVDGKARGRTPLEGSLFLAPGFHRIVVRHPRGGAELVQADSFAAGSERELKVQWPASPSVPEVALSTRTGRPTDLELRRGRMTRWAYGTLGAGIACAVTAGVLWTVGGIQGSDAKYEYDRCNGPDCPDKGARIDAAANKIVAADVIAGVGAAALGVSIYLFMKRPAAREARALSSPMLQLGANSVGLSGRF